jgi:hypothetical protein
MFDVKSIFKSTTLWGLVITALPTVAGWLGLTVAPTDAQEAVSNIQGMIERSIEFFGWAMAFYGRLTATKTLAVLPK